MSADAFIALLPIIAIALAAVVVMLLTAFKRDFRRVSWVTGCGILLALLAVVIAWQVIPVQATALLVVDGYGLFYTALLLVAGLAVTVLSYDYFRQRAGENEEVMILLLTALLGGAVLVTSDHVASLFIGLETLSVSLFVLVGYTHERHNALEASLKYLVLSGVSSALLIMGLALVYAASGELQFTAIGEALARQQQFNVLILTGGVLIIVALGFKLSLVPFHMWTSDVYEGAPAPITALVATVSKGAVFAVLLRFFIMTEGYAFEAITMVAGLIAVLTILGGNLLALLQDNVKRILAYSSIAHLGYLLVAFIAAAQLRPVLAVEAVTFYLVAYFLMTLGAFGVVSILSSPEQEADALATYRGLFRRQPWLASMMTLMLLSLAGIPLTAGFLGKFYVFAAGANAQLWGLLLTVIIGSGLGLYYYVRIIVAMTQPVEVEEKPLRRIRLRGIGATLAVLSGLVIWFGIYPGPLVDFIQSVAIAL